MHFRKVVDKRLGELLIEQGIIHHEQLEIALKHQKEHGGLIGEVLVQLKYATERDIAHAITAQYGFPYLPLTHYEIDAEVLQVVTAEICREFVLIPIDKIGKSLTIAMANPLDSEAMKKVESLTGCTVQTFVGTTTDIKEAIEKYYKE